MPYTKETVDLYAFALGYGGFFLFPITSEWDAPQLYLITDRRIIRFLSSTVKRNGGLLLHYPGKRRLPPSRGSGTVASGKR